jgi:hypothetical protein
MKVSQITIGIACFLVFLSAQSCDKMDATYKEYIAGGEIIYVGKADSVKIYPGKERIKLSWLLLSDPKIAKAVVYWNNKANSQTVDIVKSHQVDTINVILNNVAEGYHTFEIYTFDSSGNSSIKVEVAGSVYGDNYTGSLLNRGINRIDYADGNVIVNWRSSGQDAVGTQLTYTDINDNEYTIWVDKSSAETLLPSFKPNSEIRYTTAYMPVTNAIDTFYTTETERLINFRIVDNIELDRSLYAAYPLPGDALSQATAGNVLANLWSGVFAGTAASSGSWYRTANGSGMPHHFQFDLGIITKLNRYKLWQRGTVSEHNLLYANGNLRKWEVWGAASPSPDGSYDGWFKLLEGEISKLSDLPVGQNSPEDISAAASGHEFIFPNDIPEIRYIRIKAVQTWANTDYMFAGEIRFWGTKWEVE